MLQPDETVKVVGRLHWSIYIRGVGGAGGRGRAAGGVAAGCPIPTGSATAQWRAGWSACWGSLLLLAAWIRRRATEIVVTDRRVIFKRGVLSRHTVEMNVSKIETVDVEQGLAGRIWGYGTVMIRGTGSAASSRWWGWVRRWRSATRSWWGRTRGSVSNGLIALLLTLMAGSTFAVANSSCTAGGS